MEKSGTVIKLQKTNTRGKPQVWEASVDGKSVTYTWGQQGGAMSTKTDVYTEGKQKRSAEEQALFEAKSTANKKIKHGYQYTEQEDSDTPQTGSDVPLPMLAQDIHKVDAEKLRKISERIFMQPKLDGLRCVINTKKGELWSRGRTKFVGLDHISKEITERFKDVSDELWLDGELYKHGLSFQEITSIVRRTKTASADASIIEFHVFDLIVAKPFSERWAQLTRLLPDDKQGSVKLVRTEVAVLDDITSLHESFCAEGYEGAMVRMDTSTPYEGDKRSRTLIKVKSFKQDEYITVGFNGRDHDDTLASVICKMPDGREFSATPSVPESQKQLIWKHSSEFLGKIATVKFFEKTDGGIPRFPILIGFRDKQDM